MAATAKVTFINGDVKEVKLRDWVGVVVEREFGQDLERAEVGSYSVWLALHPEARFEPYNKEALLNWLVDEVDEINVDQATPTAPLVEEATPEPELT